MEQRSTGVTPDALEISGSRLRRARRWLAARRHQPDASFRFGARLFATALLTFAVIGVTGYVLLERHLAHSQIANYAAGVRADARGLEELGARAGTPAQATRAIDRFLSTVEARPGTVNAFLIDPRRVIIAAGRASSIGSRDEQDLHIREALAHGTPYFGRETDPTEDHHNFEFVVPLNLPGGQFGRHVYEVTYDHRAYDAQLHDVRMVIALIALIALIGGGGVFYLFGGRRLMRAYRIALRRATRDGLTDLPNLRAFQDELDQAVASAARYDEPVALAILDVDDFKLTNDRYGHPHGDGVLTRVAAILREARAADRPYRTGGDEFALLLAHTDAEGARTLARRLQRNLADSGITVSVGVSALRPGLQADSLRAEADAALYEAKRHGGDRSVIFEDLGADLAITTAEKKEAVRRLTEEGRLTTAFQPIWNIGAETVLGIEALARPDPSYALSGPAEAFDIAEQIGRVHQLDVLCVASALRIARELDPEVLLFINLSPSTLDMDADGDDWLRSAVERAGLSPQRVVVEVTERYGGRTEPIVSCLRRLRRQGFRIAVDDVGTGNSGLEMLRKLEAEFVKIDRSIVAAAATEPGARAVLMAMATFARQTGAFVIAEGIEDEDTVRFLRAIDDYTLDSRLIIEGGQGFGLGRPSAHVPSQPPDILRGGPLVV